MHQPLHALAGVSVEGAFERLVRARVVLAAARLGMARDRDARGGPVPDAAEDAEAALPGLADVDVGIFGEEFVNRLGVFAHRGRVGEKSRGRWPRTRRAAC